MRQRRLMLGDCVVHCLCPSLKGTVLSVKEYKWIRPKLWANVEWDDSEGVTSAHPVNNLILVEDM